MAGIASHIVHRPSRASKASSMSSVGMLVLRWDITTLRNIIKTCRAGLKHQLKQAYWPIALLAYMHIDTVRLVLIAFLFLIRLYIGKHHAISILFNSA